MSYEEFAAVCLITGMEADIYWCSLCRHIVPLQGKCPHGWNIGDMYWEDGVVEVFTDSSEGNEWEAVWPV